MEPKDFYQPPAATAALPEQFADVPMFAMKGRIGRVRYLAYSFVGGLVMLLGAGLAVGASIAIFGGSVDDGDGDGGGAFMAFLVIPYIALIAFQFALVVRRCHDIDVGGWLAVFMFVPLINFLLFLFLWFVPGTAGANRFGLRPRPPSTGWYVAAFGTPAVVIGIYASVTLPAYNEYIQNANIAKVNAHYEEGARFVANEMRRHRAETMLGKDPTLPETAEAWIALINPAGALAPGGDPAFRPGSDVPAGSGVIGVTVTGSTAEETLMVTLIRGDYEGLSGAATEIRYNER